MRSWQRVAAAGLLVVALEGCGGADKATKPVTSTAATPAVPTPVVPKAGVCHRSADPISYASTYAPVGCDTTHRSETVSVQKFTDAPTALPAAGSPALRAAFDTCDADVRAFVGADWRGGNLSIMAVTPSPADWKAGSRWFRCDVFQIVQLDGGSTRRHPDDHPVERTSSLAGALSAKSALSYTCFNEDEHENLEPIACPRPHRFEYAGVWTTSYPSLDAVQRNAEQVHEHCAQVMLSHATGRDRGIVRVAGTTYRTPSQEAWLRGDRGIRCFLWHDDRPRSRVVIARR